MTTTSLQFLINRMNAYTPIRNLDEVLKVNALDQSIRMFRMNNNPPWTLQKTSLRVFSNVFLYPVPVDLAQVSIVDDPLGQDMEFGEHPRYVYTSLRDFLEDPTARNSIAEVWQAGTKFIGVRNKTDVGLTESLLGDVGVASEWAGSGDAGTPVLDNVVTLTATTSIRVPITNSSGTATITDTFGSSSPSDNYQRKYFFVAVYIQASTVPTSIGMRLRQDSGNYLETAVTAQFAGQPFVANDWNVLAIDLNTATKTGSITGSFTSAIYTVTGMGTGNLYFDDSFLRGWILQDFWYYSIYNVLNGSTYQEFFAPDSATYSLASVLLGDTNWHDPMMYMACLFLLSDQKESAIYLQVQDLFTKANTNLLSRYPDETPQISTNIYRFGTDYQDEMGWPDIAIRG